MSSITEKNKAIVVRFNKECIGQGNLESFRDIVSEDCINHAARPGMPNGAESMRHFILDVLRTGFPDIKVTLHEQIAEGDLVTTRKTLHAEHMGNFMGIPATRRSVAIEVIDIIRLKDGKYVEHWGQSNIPSVIAGLSVGNEGGEGK